MKCINLSCMRDMIYFISITKSIIKNIWKGYKRETSHIGHKALGHRLTVTLIDFAYNQSTTNDKKKIHIHNPSLILKSKSNILSQMKKKKNAYLSQRRWGGEARRQEGWDWWAWLLFHCYHCLFLWWKGWFSHCISLGFLLIFWRLFIYFWQCNLFIFCNFSSPIFLPILSP